MSKNTLKLIFVIAVLIAAFFIAGKITKTQNDQLLIIPESEKQELADLPESENIIEKPKPPVLDRSLNVTTSLSGLEKDEVIEQIKHFEASLLNKPENMHEWIQLGNLRKMIGDYMGAQEYWKYASLLEPTYHVPYNNLGNLYQYILNDVVKAEEYFKKMIEVSPQNEDSYKNLFELYTISYKEKESLALGILEEGIKNVTHNGNLKQLLENYKANKQISE